MIKYVLKQNHNEKSAAYGKYYAFPVVEETMDLEDLARHMEEHNTGFSEAMCVGVMKAMVKCIKEQLLAGKNVKIDNLAIFSCGIRNKEGAAKAEDFSVANNISGVKLRARATGTLSNASLNLAASIRKASTVVGGSTGGDDTNPDGGGTGSSSGSGSGTGGSTTGSGSTTKKTLSLSASPSIGGTVSGGGEYAPGSDVEIRAVPKSGYSFSKWSDNDTNPTRTVTVTSDLSLTAIFTAVNNEDDENIR